MYVQDAYARLKSAPQPNMSDPLHKFICDCVGHLPAKYGPMIQNKIIKELRAIGVKSDIERGDFRKNKTYFEFKTSFLSKGISYSITNIRNWHNFDYYVLCFIDTVNDFTPNFYVIKKDDIQKFKLRGMNGTVESNTVNKNIGMRVTLQVNSQDMKVFQDMNLLNDTSFESLYEFVDSFKMKKDKPKGCKFDFLSAKFDSNNVTENYINFLKFFISLNSHSENCGLDIVKESLGKFSSFKRHELSPCSKKKKQYVRLYDSLYVSTYTSTNKKINHIKKILESYNSGCKHPVPIEFYT